MAEYHVRLALEYLQARNTADRTLETLVEIMQHLSDTYALSAAEAIATLVQTQRLARQRGLIPNSEEMRQ